MAQFQKKQSQPPSIDPAIAALRIPPHSIEAEQSVLGGLLLDTGAYDKISDAISETDFYRDEHRRIFRVIQRMQERGKPADVVTVAEALDAAGETEHTGGLAYLGELAQNTPSAANIKRYAEIVRERSIMRQLAQIGTEIADSAYNPMGRDARELLDEAETKVFRIAESTARSQQDFLNMEQILTEVVERVNELYGRDNLDDVTGIPTGFVDLDKKTSGLQKGDLVIVAGRPSMGKTAFSMNIAENVALNTGLPVAVFSMEMGATQLAMRMIGSVGRLDQHALRTGQLSDEEMDKFGMAVSRLTQLRPRVPSPLRRLAELGSAAGVSVWAATQRPSTKLGVGAPATYRTACQVAATALARSSGPTSWYSSACMAGRSTACTRPASRVRP